MLAIASGDKNFDCVKILLEFNVNYLCEDDYGNSIIHLAATYQFNKLLEYFVQNLNIDLLKWNKNCETAMSICTKFKNKEGINILKK